MNQKIKNHKAFSLIEMSIVILLIGLMIAALTASTTLVTKYRLGIARLQTQSAPVTIVKGLKLWYETTSKKSFDLAEAENGLAISTWYDITPNTNIRSTATSSSTARPFYTTNCVNSLPCLRFDGSNDLLSFDGSFLVANDFTIFVVEQRRSNVSGNWFISGDGGSTNANLVLGYVSNTAVRFAMWANDLDSTVPSYVSPTPKIHAFILSSVNGKYYYLNGSSAGSNASQTAQLVSYANASIGRSNVSNFYYNGDICEIIMFDRALTTDERRNIEAYLSQKWKIAVS